MKTLDELMPSAADLRKLFEAQQEWLLQRVAGRDQDSLFPYLAILLRGPAGDSVTLCCLAGDFNSDEGKRTALRTLGRSCFVEKQIPVCIVLSCEAWLAKNPPPGVRPADFAGREEVLLLMGMSIDRRHNIHATAPVTRVRGMICASEFSDPLTEGVQSPLLRHFYEGFFEAAASRVAATN